jgi:ABC-type glycerol-3-phosphate transport system substrate-binding protein
MKKKFLCGTIGVCVFFSLASCAKKTEKAEAEKSVTLTVWSFTDELDGMINKYYKPAYPSVKIEYSMTPTDQFTNKLNPVLQAGQGVPDIFALEDAFVRTYIESGLLLDLTDIYEANKDKLLPYPVEIGSYNGRVYGMSWQATPGALFYRRSLAKKYLGTDDPAEVQAYLSDLPKFLETAQLLKEQSGGSCRIIATTGELDRPFHYARKDPWVVDGKLVVDPAMIEYMKVAKLMNDEGYTMRLGQWSEGWYAGMKDALTDENGEGIQIFCYLLPTWGLHFVLKTNAPDTSGDWGMVPGPAPYRWGGTWLGAWKDTPHKEEVKEFIRYLTTDDGFLEAWAAESGDLVSNTVVVEKIKDSYSEPFLAGQNHYAEFAEMAKGVNGRLTQGTDQAVDMLYGEAITAYIFEELTLEEALESFTEQAKSQLGLL